MMNLQCYNKSCGLTFDPEANTTTSCHYHPGVPVFHDALKGWSCCKKRSTDFSEFLKFPGCTIGRHSNEKPVQPVKPRVINEKPKLSSEVSTPVTIKPIVVEERPHEDAALLPLTVKTAKSYSQTKAEGNKNEEATVGIKEGSSCVHKGCHKTFSCTTVQDDECWYHPGVAVFHEGMKYWSCCQRKTSDFNNFLSQVGCTKGKCDFTPLQQDTVTKCRYDWHQTSKFVNISIFAKCANLLTSTFTANPVVINCNINFQGDKQFNLKIILTGVVDIDNSFVTISGTKVELSLRKKGAHTWKTLGEEVDVTPQVEVATNDVVEPPPHEDKMSRLELEDLNYIEYMDRPVKDADDSSDHSSLSGIDDTEFD